jgi:tRNA threonylcarbamoyladenosine biosynthesis protein TsaB
LQADRQASLRPVLAVDTCGKRLGVALVAGDATFASEPADSAARADHVGEVASALLASAGLRVEDLAALAVTIGPGSYTGVRIGLALVRGLSLVDQTPVVALGSLELLSLATPSAAGRICALLDASRDSVYAAVYDRAGDALGEVMAPRIVERSAVTDVLREHASGGIAARCESEGALELDARVSQVLVPASRARRLAEIARARVAEGRIATADSVMPLYIGTSSARPNTNKVVVSSRAGE